MVSAAEQGAQQLARHALADFELAVEAVLLSLEGEAGEQIAEYES